METAEKEPRPSGGQEIPGWIRVLIGFPLAALGVVVTVVVGILLVAYVATRIGGGPREPGFLGSCFLWLVFGLGPLFLGTWLLENSSKAPISEKACLSVVLLLAVLGADMLLAIPCDAGAEGRPEAVLRALGG